MFDHQFCGTDHNTECFQQFSFKKINLSRWYYLNFVRTNSYWKLENGTKSETRGMRNFRSWSSIETSKFWIALRGIEINHFECIVCISVPVSVAFSNFQNWFIPCSILIFILHLLESFFLHETILCLALLLALNRWFDSYNRPSINQNFDLKLLGIEDGCKKGYSYNNKPI